MHSRYTLGELCFTTGLLAVVLSCAIPLLHAAQAQAHQDGCLNNIRQLTLGETMYARDNNDYRTPVVNGEPYRCGALKSARQLGLLYVRDYCTSPQAFYCPDLIMTDNRAVCANPAELRKDLKKDTYTGYWSANWHECPGKWIYESFKLSGPFPTFTGWHASGKTPGEPSAMPLVMDFAATWPGVNPGGLPHGNSFNVSFADGSATTYVDSAGKITSGDWHNVWLAPDVIMQYRDAGN